jgi:hypothetical protein
MKDIYCNSPHPNDSLPPLPLTETSQCLCPQSIKERGGGKEKKNPSINPIVAAVIV